MSSTGEYNPNNSAHGDLYRLALGADFREEIKAIIRGDNITSERVAEVAALVAECADMLVDIETELRRQEMGG